MLQSSADEWMQLGLRHHQAGKSAEAESAYRQVLALLPRHGQAWNNLGVLLLHADRFDEAAACFARAMECDPRLVEAVTNMGAVWEARGDFPQAIRWHEEALRRNPENAGAHYNLGVTLSRSGRVAEAAAAYRRAVDLKPDYLPAYNNLGNALKKLDRPDEAIGAFRLALAIVPGFGEAWCNLGEALAARGEMDEALDACREAVRLRPTDAVVHSNLLYALQFHPRFDARMIAAEHRAWNERHAEPLRGKMRPHANDRHAERRLRIGLVSPDFCRHCQSMFTVPLLTHLDREAFEVTAYASVANPDDQTAQLAGLCARWRDIRRISDEQAAEMIRADGIDILIDLTMHMSDNRLLIFARKPAPVQASWLAYPGTTGMRAIDYRISDPYLDPPGEETYASEKTVRLEETFWCYDPLTSEPEVGEQPALAGGQITFGCLNNSRKVHAGVVEVWGEVMSEVAGSRLMVMCPPGVARERVAEILVRRGIGRERLEFVGFEPRERYLRHYQRIDIGLDTWPYNGHTTSLDAYWMGVPVVTLVGERIVGRAGLSQLSNLGLPELIARQPGEYVRIAAELARDLERLRGLRRTLRERMRGSALMDGARFARRMETALRAIWRTYCEGTGTT